jgi:hypothetical protein
MPPCRSAQRDLAEDQFMPIAFTHLAESVIMLLRRHRKPRRYDVPVSQ